MGRLGNFLRSRHNAAGLVLAAGGVGLYAAGVVAGLAALPVTAGLYVLGAVAVPRRRAVLDPYPEDATDTADVGHALDDLLRSMAGRLPSEIFDQVASIRRSILVTLQDVAGAAVADPNVFLIRQTALSYLPEALNGYLAIPPGYRDRSLEGQKSAREVLVEQLSLMDRKMREAAEAIVADDAQKLAVHGRFLADKFGGSSLDVRTADGAGAGTAAVPVAADAVESAARAAAARAAAGAAAGTAAGAAAGPADSAAESAAADEEARRSAERRAVAARVAKAAQRASAIAAELSGAPQAPAAAEHSAEPAPEQAAAEQAAADFKDSLDRIRG